MRSYICEAIVIKRRNFLEKDRILTVFSRDEGKIDLLAKGARRPGSRLAYISDIGTYAKFHIGKGKSLDLITEAQILFLPEETSGNLEKTEKLSYILKTIGRVYEENDSHPKTFEVLKQAIITLDQEKFRSLVLIFLANIINELGITPDFYNCIFCAKKIQASDDIVFSHEGGLAHGKCCVREHPLAVDEVKALRILFENPLHKTVKIKFEDKLIKKLYSVIRLYMNWHYHDLLPDKEL